MYHQEQQQQQPQKTQAMNSDAAPHPHAAPNCPRCASTNTKFCYYNNYSLTQPRYFCKACRRYWTNGGSLRNVPVGGGCRKTRRSRSKSHRQNNPPPSSAHDNNNSSSSSSGQSSSGGADIDMAAVFARYVSQGENGNHVVAQKKNEVENDVELELESFDFEMVDDFYWSTMAPLTEIDTSPLVDELLDSNASWSACFDVAGCADFYN